MLPKVEAGLAAGLVLRQAAADVLGGEEFDGESSSSSASSRSRRPKKLPTARLQMRRSAGHALPPFIARKRDMIPVACCHWD